MRLGSFLAALALAGCTGGSDPTKDSEDTDPVGDDDDVTGDDDDITGDDDDDDNTPTGPCENQVTDAFPEDGQTGAYFLAEVRFSLAVEEPGATITVTDSSGAEIAGTTTVEGTLVSWQGDPRDPLTTYTAQIDYVCGAEVATWTTSDAGAPLTVDVVGDTFALDIAAGEWVEPAGVGALLASQIGDTQILMSPSAIAGSSIEAIVAIGSANAQDLCSPTIDLPPASWQDPTFSLSTPLLPLSVSGFTILIEDVELSGSFAPDGSRIEGGLLSGLVDTRPLGEVFGLGTGYDAVCDLVSAFGVSCITCSDGSGDYCLSLLVDNVSAPLLPATTLVERTEDDILADPSCN